MPKRYIILFTLFVGLVATIFATQKKELDFSMLKPQLGRISTSGEWINTQAANTGIEEQL